MCQPQQPPADPAKQAMGTNVAVAFWVFGLINNFTFVLFATAAEDILRGYAGVVLLCIVLPGLMCKFVFAVIGERMSFLFRISLVSINSTICSIVVAIAPQITVKLCALVMYSAIGTLGEMTFLALTSKHSEWVVGTYSSGTGAAGIFGAGFYVLLTQAIGLSSKATLLVCSGIPLIMIVTYLSIPNETVQQEAGPVPMGDTEQLLTPSAISDFDTFQSPSLDGYSAIPTTGPLEPEFNGKTSRTKYMRHLAIMYMLPLATVYFAEYTINAGVMGTMTVYSDGKTYDLSRTYGRLQFLYQIAVFFSRSSIQFFRFHRLWLLALLQVVNLAVCVIGSVFVLFPSLNFVSGLILWEGCLGGLMYVNAFFKLRSEAPPHLQQWALATATIGDSVGTAISAFFSIWLEKAIIEARGAA